MLRKFYSLSVAVTLFGSFILSAEDTQGDSTMSEVADAEMEVSTEAIGTSETAVTQAMDTKAAAEKLNVEVPEAELVKLVGFVLAQGGGISGLDLSDAEVAIISDGLVAGLSGTKSFEDMPQESIQASFLQAQNRFQAIEEELEEIPSISEDSLQTMGFVMAMQSRLNDLGFGAEEIPLINQGFLEGANLSEPSPDMEAKFPAFQEFMQSRVLAAQAKANAEAEKVAAERIAAGKSFFEELSTDTDVQKSDSGLYYKIVKPGTEPKPSMEDSVLVHYKGTLVDGTQFDSSYDRGSPAKFPLNGVVKGFGEGLTKIGAGGEIILYIPSELGYGNSPRPGGVIKPGDTLIFKCELIEINP